MTRAIWLAAACGLLLGCDGAFTGDGDADADAHGDGDADGDGDPDADLDGDGDGGPASCEEALVLGETFEVGPDLPDTQIHPTAVFDGETIWVAFTLVEEDDTGLFDTWLVGLGCAGEIRSDPERVNTLVPPNDIDPVLALAGDRLLVLWTSDTGEFPDNMHTRYRVLGLDGAEVMAEDARLQTSRGGEVVAGNAFHPSAVALPEGGFAVAGGRGLPEMTVLQAYVQLLTADGGLDGEARDAYFEDGVGQSETAIARYPGGELAVAWTRSPVIYQEVVWKIGDDGAGEPEPLAPEEQESRSPSLSAHPDAPEHVYAAFAFAEGTGSTIRLVDVGSEGAEGPRLDLGVAGRADHAPTVVATAEGAVLGWFRNIRGSMNEIVVQAFVHGGSDLVAGEERIIAPFESASSLYGMGLVAVTPDVALVIWAEGASPAFRLYGRFLSLR